MKFVFHSLLVNAAAAAVAALLYGWFADGPSLSRALKIFGWSAAYANAIGMPAAYLLPRLLPCVGNWRPASRWGITVLVLIAIALVGSTAVSLLMVSVGAVHGQSFGDVWRGGVKMSLLLTLAFGIGSTWYHQTRHRLEESTLALRTRELEKERALTLASEARLQSLESRVHPHFLFNALNSVAALIREQPDQAELQIERISRFLRFSLDRGMSGLVPLSEELRIVTDYLEIERTRFGGRLRFAIDAQPAALKVELPPMSVQTLVENAVKYAVAPRREGGQIDIAASVDGGRLSVEVRDDGPGFDYDARSSGHGLDLLTERLAAQFGDSASIRCRNGAGMSVRLEIPCAHS